MIKLGIEIQDTRIVCVLAKDKEMISTHHKEINGSLEDVLKGLLSDLFLKHPELDCSNMSINLVVDVYRYAKRHNIPQQKVVVIRLATNTTHAVLPFCEFSHDMKYKLESASYIVDGGYEYDGTPILDVSLSQIDNILQHSEKISAQFAISGVFSIYNDTQERQVKQHILEMLPYANVALSSTFGNTGLLERENAAILSCSLHSSVQDILLNVRNALMSLQIDDNKLYVCLNDGTKVHYQDLASCAIRTYDVNQVFEHLSTLNSLESNSQWLKKYIEKMNIRSSVVNIDGVDVAMMLPSYPIYKQDDTCSNLSLVAYASCFSLVCIKNFKMITDKESTDRLFLDQYISDCVQLIEKDPINYVSIYTDISVVPVPHHPQKSSMLTVHMYCEL